MPPLTPWAMEISSNKETRTTTLRTINREKATTGDKIVDVVLPPPSLSSSLSSLSSSDGQREGRTRRHLSGGRCCYRSEDEEDEDLNAQLAEAIRKGDASKIADVGVKLKEKEDREKQKLIEPNYVAKVQKAALKDEEKSVVDLFTKSKSAVVFITNVAVRRDAFTLSLTEQPQGAGSGIIWDDEGRVVTNYHVIKRA